MDKELVIDGIKYYRRDTDEVKKHYHCPTCSRSGGMTGFDWNFPKTGEIGVVYLVRCPRDGDIVDRIIFTKDGSYRSYTDPVESERDVLIGGLYLTKEKVYVWN